MIIPATLIDKVKSASTIAVIGNGGNLAIAKHAASDMSRHLNKFCFAPECVHMSALGGDNRWHEIWTKEYASKADLIIGITTRIDSPIAQALESQENCFLIAPVEHSTIPTLVINKETFHEFEVETLWQFYMIMEQCGAVLPKIG